MLRNFNFKKFTSLRNAWINLKISYNLQKNRLREQNEKYSIYFPRITSHVRSYKADRKRTL